MHITAMKLYWRYLKLVDGRKITKLLNEDHRQINYAYGITRPTAWLQHRPRIFCM